MQFWEGPNGHHNYALTFFQICRAEEKKISHDFFQMPYQPILASEPLTHGPLVPKLKQRTCTLKFAFSFFSKMCSDTDEDF